MPKKHVPKTPRSPAKEKEFQKLVKDISKLITDSRIKTSKKMSKMLDDGWRN